MQLPAVINAGRRIGDPSKMAAAQYVSSNRQQSMGRLPIYVYGCNGGWECVCCSAVNDGSCSPWVMCSCSVVRGNQIRDT